MRAYVVAIRRTYVHGRDVTIHAENEQEAERLALEQIGNYDLNIIDMKPEEDFAETRYEIG